MDRSWYTTSTNSKSADSIHQILAFGTIEEVKKLKKSVGEAKLRKLFLSYPKKVYTAPALNFIKNFILHINNRVNGQKYLKSAPRNIG